MRIVVDAFGGDNAPLEIVKGSRKAADKFGVETVAIPASTSSIKDFTKFFVREIGVYWHDWFQLKFK